MIKLNRKKYSHNFIVKNNDQSMIDNKKIKEIVENTLIKYKKSKIQFEYYDTLDNINTKSKEQLKKYIDLIETILNNLTFLSKEIIENEYLKNFDITWWKGKYARSTYFKMKQLAYKEFYIYVS